MKNIDQSTRSSIFPFFVGTIMWAILLWDLPGAITHYSFQIVSGLFIGLGLGACVFMVERLRYSRLDFEKPTHSPYETTSLWKFVFLLLLALMVLLNMLNNETGYTMAFASGTYMLTLAVFIFCLRKKKQIAMK